MMDTARMHAIHGGAEPTREEIQALAEDAHAYCKTRTQETLRDRFAMAALEGLLGGNAFQRADRRHEAMSEQAYKFADAMMQARDA